MQKSGDAPRTLKEEAIQSNKEVSRKLIAAFMERTKEDWPKLMVFSKTWKTLAEGVFEEMAIMGSEEQDPTK